MSGRHFLFATTELEPHTPGGAGALVARLAGLLRAAGHQVTVVLAAPGAAAGPGVVVAGEPDPEAPHPLLGRSRALAEAVARRAAAHRPELIEVQDFDGAGYWLLAHRVELGLDAIPVAVRMHGPVDMVAGALGRVPDGLAGIPVMEREAFAMADAVIVPAPGWVDEVVSRYGLQPSRVVVGEPPVPSIPAAARRPAPVPEFVAYGRLSEVKGSHDFVAAAVELLDSGVEARFRLIGPDGWSASAGRPMREWLRDLVPASHRDRVRLEPALPRDEVPAAVAGAWAVVVPSRFESFGLAAHEVRAMGLPLVVPDLTAFRAFFTEATGALVYDGSVPGLAGALRRLAGDPGLVERLAAAPPPRYGDPLAPYTGPLPEPRHPRSQAGLATAAGQRVEAALPRPAAAPAALTRAARAALRALPEPVARLAVRVLPQALKDRFRTLASWPAEEARRRRRGRLAAFRAGVAAGALPEVDDPEVTVVIPCFNQGDFLEDALASVFEQTFDSFEVVVVDDGSTDPATVATLDALDLPRTRVIRQENRGLPAARNAGMAAARGRYLVPLDADDELRPGYLAALHPALAADGDAAFAHCWAELYGDVEAIWATRPYNPYQQLVSNSVVGCVLLRRAAWEAAGGYDESMTHGNEDWDLWIRLHAAGWANVAVRHPLFRYRKHGVSMSVETEARFEAARREAAARHPDLYSETALRRLKAEWYPWVSVLAETRSARESLAAQTLDDLEVVPSVDRARGKFLVDWEAVRSAAPDALARLAATLEADPGAAAAGPPGSPVLWRHWTVADPRAPHHRVAEVPVAVEATAGRLERGSHPSPQWTVTPEPDWPDVPLQRQPPEVEGRLPAWVEARSS